MKEFSVPVGRRTAGLPIHPLLIMLPTACFIGAFSTDVTYSRTADEMWSNFSAWLISVGVIICALTAVTGLTDLAFDRYQRIGGWKWVYALGHAVILVLAILDALVHTRDGWTSVVPTGLGLSGALIILLVPTTWIGCMAIYRQPVGAAR